MEMIGGHYIDSQLRDNNTAAFTPDLSMALMIAVEEFLEMLGILVFVYALLSYINLDLKEAQISFSERKLSDSVNSFSIAPIGNRYIRAVDPSIAASGLKQPTMQGDVED